MKYASMVLAFTLTAAIAFAQLPAGQQNKNSDEGNPTFPPDQKTFYKPSTKNPQIENAEQAPGQVEKGSAVEDQALASQVLEQLWALPAFSGVVATVSNAVVTLEGIVPSQEEGNHVKRVVESIPGVKRVENNVRVEPPNEPSSSQITAPQRNAATTSREATKENRSGSISGKTTAPTGGTTRHVQTQSRSTEMSLTAEEVQRQIERKLASEAGLSSENVSLQVTADTVTLSGSVPTVKDVGIVKRIAESYAGNRTLIDRLVISPGRDRNAIPGLETPPRETVPDNSQEPENNPR